MDRKEFLSLLGLGAGAAVLTTCLGGCSKSSNGSSSVAPSTADFTLDLSQAANAALLNNGGYLYHDGIIVAKTQAGNYIAVQQVCTHENVSVIYQAKNQRFYCSGHGATFSETGVVTGGPAPRDLKQYNTSLNGSNLRIYS